MNTIHKAFKLTGIDQTWDYTGVGMGLVYQALIKRNHLCEFVQRNFLVEHKLNKSDTHAISTAEYLYAIKTSEGVFGLPTLSSWEDMLSQRASQITVEGLYTFVSSSFAGPEEKAMPKLLADEHVDWFRKKIEQDVAEDLKIRLQQDLPHKSFTSKTSKL